MSEKKIEVCCGACAKPLFYGVVLFPFKTICGECSWVMRVEPEQPKSELAEAIVAAMRAAPTVTVDGRTICNCSECRRRRSELGLIEG